MALLDLFRSKQRGTYNVRWTINKAGDWVYPDERSDTYINQAYKGLPNPYGLIGAILKKSTIAPFEVFRVKSRTKEMKYKALMSDPKNAIKALRYKNEAYEKVEDSDIERLLMTPNNYQSLQELWYNIDGYKLLTGNSYLYYIGVGSAQELHNIPAPCVDINVTGGVFSPQFKYKVNYIQEMLPGEDVMHFKYWNPIDSGQSPTKQFKGLSPLQSCRLLLGKYKDADLTQGFQFKNMGPGGMITGATNTADGLTEVQATAIQDKFKQQHQGVHKAGDILVTPSALTWTAFGLSPVDLNISGAKKEMVEELCNVYNYPSELLGGDKKYNNYDHARRAAITDAVIPLVEARKDVLNKFIKDRLKSDLVIEFDYLVYPEMQEDAGKQAEAATKMYWITPNEKRDMTGYDKSDLPGMDDIYLPSGLSSIADHGVQDDTINEEMLPPES